MKKRKNVAPLHFLYEAATKYVFNEIVEVLRDNFVANFIRKADDTLWFRFANGQEFLLTIKETRVDL